MAVGRMVLRASAAMTDGTVGQPEVGTLNVTLAVMAAMWQVAEGYFLDSQSSACCLVHLVVTGGHLVRMAIGAA